MRFPHIIIFGPIKENAVTAKNIYNEVKKQKQTVCTLVQEFRITSCLGPANTEDLADVLDIKRSCD